MSETSVEARLLTALARAVLDANFTPSEARAAAKAVRDNKIFAPVAHLLDVLGASVSAADIVVPKAAKEMTVRDSRVPTPGLSVDAVFDAVKRRKVTKAQLFEMFTAVNNSASPELQDQVSIREALALFKSLASDDDWRTLQKIIEGRVELDPFLRGILKR